MNCGADLQFPVSQIKENNGLSVSTSVPAAHLFSGLEPSLKHDGDPLVSLVFSLNGSRILLDAEVLGAWKVECSRCLREHSVRYRSAVQEEYPSSTETIPAADVVREAALLEIPQRSLCSADCRIPWGENGLEEPLKNEAPLQTSPFEALKKLKEK